MSLKLPGPQMMIFFRHSAEKMRIGIPSLFQMVFPIPQAQIRISLNMHTKGPKKEALIVFLSNNTTWASNSKSLLCSDAFFEESDVLMLGEHRYIDVETIVSSLRARGYKVFTNPAEYTGTSDKGAPGGELLAFKNHLTSLPIDPLFLDSVIRDCAGIPLRFAAAVLRLRHFNILFICAYMWDSKGSGEYNTLMLKSIAWLMHILGCPFTLGGDINFAKQTLAASDWL